jgi:UDP-3-O-[3-hydroxymyristoyl] glucosamine N-acyltransferase
MSLALVTKSVPAGSIVSGNPARPHREQLKHEALLRRLDGLMERVESLERTAKKQPNRKAAKRGRRAN